MILLICQHCKRPNAAESKFCGDCGTELYRRECSACHAANDVEAKHCHACGAALGSAQIEMPAPAPAPTPVAVPAMPAPEAMPAEPAPLSPSVPPMQRLAELTDVLPRVSAPVWAPETGLVSLPATTSTALSAAPWPGPTPVDGARRPTWLAPFFIGLGTVGTVAFAAIALVQWSATAPTTKSAASAQPPALAGASLTPAPAVDTAADAAAAAAARLLAPKSETPARGAELKAEGTRAATPTPMVAPVLAPPAPAPAARQVDPPAPIQAVARPPPRTVQPVRVDAAPAAAPAAAPVAAAVAPVAPQAAPGATEAAQPARVVRPTAPKPSLPSECTPALAAMALCGPGS